MIKMIFKRNYQEGGLLGLKHARHQSGSLYFLFKEDPLTVECACNRVVSMLSTSGTFFSVIQALLALYFLKPSNARTR